MASLRKRVLEIAEHADFIWTWGGKIFLALGGGALIAAILHGFAVVRGLWLLAVVLLSAALIFLALQELQQRFPALLKVEGKEDEANECAPKLVCRGVSFHKQPIVEYSTELTGSPVVPTLTSRIVGIPDFYHLEICNEPMGKTNRKVAEKVAATVLMLHENGTPAAVERLHRWEHSLEPIQAGKAADQSLPVDILPSGIHCNLDIAMKYDQDDAFYTPNNDTAMPGKPRDWREEEFKFPPGTYIAEIHFRGVNVVSNMKYQIVNKGKGSKLEITPLSN